MYVQQSMGIVMRWQCHLREVNCADTGAVVTIHDHLLGHLYANIFLGFLSRAADMGGQNHIVKFAQWRENFALVGLWLFVDSVD
mgnify:CR=1 FL=1